MTAASVGRREGVTATTRAYGRQRGKNATTFSPSRLKFNHAIAAISATSLRRWPRPSRFAFRTQLVQTLKHLPTLRLDSLVLRTRSAVEFRMADRACRPLRWHLTWLPSRPRRPQPQVSVSTVDEPLDLIGKASRYELTAAPVRKMSQSESISSNALGSSCRPSRRLASRHRGVRRQFLDTSGYGTYERLIAAAQPRHQSGPKVERSECGSSWIWPVTVSATSRRASVRLARGIQLRLFATSRSTLLGVRPNRRDERPCWKLRTENQRRLSEGEVPVLRVNGYQDRGTP